MNMPRARSSSRGAWQSGVVREGAGDETWPANEHALAGMDDDMVVWCRKGRCKLTGGEAGIDRWRHIHGCDLLLDDLAVSVSGNVRVSQ